MKKWEVVLGAEQLVEGEEHRIPKLLHLFVNSIGMNRPNRLNHFNHQRVEEREWRIGGLSGKRETLSNCGKPPQSYGAGEQIP